MAFTTANTAMLRRSSVWSTQLKEVVQEELDAVQWVRWLTDFPDGDTFRIPSIGDATVRDYVENLPVVYDAMDTGEFTFTITDYLQSGTYITDKAKQDGYYMEQLVASFLPKQARAIMERLETRILGLAAAGASGGQTGSALNAINGAGHRFVGSGASERLTLADFSRARYALNKAGNADSRLIAIVDPSAAYTLENTASIVALSNNNAQWDNVVGTGLTSNRRFVRNIFGFDVYTSNFLPKLQNETISGITTAFGVANIFFSLGGSEDMKPFVGAWRQMPKVDSEYNKDFQREEYVTTCRFGLKVYRPENLVVILTDTDVVA